MRVAGSNPVFRSDTFLKIYQDAEVVELVDTLDLKSNDRFGRAGSSPAFSTKALSFDKAFLFIISYRHKKTHLNLSELFNLKSNSLNYRHQ